MRDFILIFVNGRRHEVNGADAFLSLSDFLRQKLRLCGVKVVCAEGDCGSCTVLRGVQSDEAIAYRPVCSCILFMYQLDGAHIVTVEGLEYGGKLNPIQQSMVKCHGAQCGFCTPGIVVALQGLYENCGARTPDDDEIRTSLTGNLCRCTGYSSILQSAAEVERHTVRSVNDLYTSASMLSEMRAATISQVSVTHGDRRLFKPIEIVDAVQFKAAHPDTTVISGGTDIGVAVNKGLRDPKTVLVTGGLRDFNSILVENESLLVGAGASLAHLENIAAKHLPEFSRLLYWFGSPPIRNAGTIGGNIANGSPIGDSMPALFVLNAEIELTGVNGARLVNINMFYSGYRTTVMTADELITRVIIPLPARGGHFRLYKISRRKDLDISAIAAAFLLRMDGTTISDARIAFGGVGPTVMRAPDTEAALRGATLTLESFEHAGEIAREEVAPIDDVRGSAEYRKQLVQNILTKLYFDLTGENTPGTSDNGRPHNNGNGNSRVQNSPSGALAESGT